MGQRPFGCWDCGFESSRIRGSLSVVNGMCFHVEVSAMGRSLIQRSPTEFVRVVERDDERDDEQQ